MRVPLLPSPGAYGLLRPLTLSLAVGFLDWRMQWDTGYDFRVAEPSCDAPFSGARRSHCATLPLKTPEAQATILRQSLADSTVATFVVHFGATAAASFEKVELLFGSG